MRLTKNEPCPIHNGNRFCCGRDYKEMEKSAKWVQIEPGVHRHIQTGLVRRSPAALRKLLSEKVRKQNNLCALCGKPFTDAREIVADHIQPRGMGGARRDDSRDNIQAAHNLCNLEKGSKRKAVRDV